MLMGEGKGCLTATVQELGCERRLRAYCEVKGGG